MLNEHPSLFEYIPCEGCESNNMRCEEMCGGCDDWCGDEEEGDSF